MYAELSTQNSKLYRKYFSKSEGKMLCFKYTKWREFLIDLCYKKY